jgi:hypothetical protein
VGVRCQLQGESKEWIRSSREIFYSKIRKDISLPSWKSEPTNTTLCSTISVKYVQRLADVCIPSELQTGITDVSSVRLCRRNAAVQRTCKTSLALTRPPFPPMELDVMSRKQKLRYYV